VVVVIIIIVIIIINNNNYYYYYKMRSLLAAPFEYDKAITRKRNISSAQ